MANNPRLAKLMDQLLEEAITGLLSRLTAKKCMCEDCDARAATAQDYANVLKLLKDNGFTVDPLKAGDALDEIIQKMNNTASQTYPTTTIS